jgi:hypothetical protein
MKDKDVTLPNFDEWALNINVDSLITEGYSKQDAIREALQQAFEQGWSMGVRDGQEIAEREWWRHQDTYVQESPEFGFYIEKAKRDFERDMEIQESLSDYDKEEN